MGMYTELLLKVRVHQKIPAHTRTIFAYLFNGDSRPAADTLPNHPFFRCERWTSIGACSSHYHVPHAFSKYDYDSISSWIFSRSDLKNYENEINLFLDWADPYFDEEKNACLGYQWYEEDEEPTLIYKLGDNLV